MNERIRQLLAQCQQESIDGPEYPRWTDLDKFSDLIINECLNVVGEQRRRSLDRGDLLAAHTIQQVAVNIKRHFEEIREHFGVDE